ncbi:MAG: hypothetical protein K1X67_20575 [Fimbriimonadaceae bacterium]|nr:hypothetical protein [Fimbriimonadaceae bacterium]
MKNLFLGGGRLEERLSANQVIRGLAERDSPIGISNTQLKAWRDWGLLTQDADGLWEANSIEKIVRIHEVGKTIDAIPRRVIMLNAENVRVLPPVSGEEDARERSEWFFQVPSEALRRAMLEVAPRIRPHLKKMKRIASSVAAIPSEATDNPRGTRRKQSPMDSLPRCEEWEAVLREASAEEFTERSSVQYYVAALLRELGRRGGVDVSDIPFEEQIVLLTIRDLYWRREQRRQKSSSQSGEAQ